MGTTVLGGRVEFTFVEYLPIEGNFMVPLVVLFSSFVRGHVVGRLQSGADVLTGHFYQAFNFLSLTRSLLVRQDWGGCVAIYTIIITATDRLTGRTEGMVAVRMEAKNRSCR